MKRSKPPRRTKLKPGKRLRAKPTSIDERMENDAIREAVFRRDGRLCQLHGVAGAGACSGAALTPHHRLKDGQGGAYDLTNLVTLCAGHNNRIEADADLADLCRRRGIVLRAWEHPAAIPYLTRYQPTPEAQ